MQSRACMVGAPLVSRTEWGEATMFEPVFGRWPGIKRYEGPSRAEVLAPSGSLNGRRLKLWDCDRTPVCVASLQGFHDEFEPKILWMF